MGFDHAALETSLGGVRLKSPIGLAAGFDKNAEILPFLGALGFGFIEVGSVTAHACLGTPKPRIARLTKDESLINWMGLPNDGVDAIRERLTFEHDVDVPFGVNIAKTPDFAYEALGLKPKEGVADFLETYEKLSGLGAYAVLNLSCPNTGETRSFEDSGLFRELGSAVLSVKTRLKDGRPLLLKLSPDTEPKALSELVTLACEMNFDGFVVSNTTRQRPNLSTPLSGELRHRGGLSGRALASLALAQLKRVRAICGKGKTLIAVGGIMSVDDVIERLRAGADLCQIYTGLIYNGPFFVKALNRGLARYCEQNGLKSYKEIAS